MNKINSKYKDFAEKTVIATTTFYKPGSESDKVRAELSRRFVKRATDLGYDVMIVDGGSAEELLKEYERYGAKVFEEEKMQVTNTIGRGRRQAIREAFNIGKNVVAWIEPEKEPYIPELIKTVEPVIDGIDIVVPKRKSLESYPHPQKMAENSGNRFWAALTKTELDVWFGPRTFKNEIAEYFLNYKGEYGDMWDSIFIPVMNAIYDSKSVISIEVDYVHPESQRIIEEKDPQFSEKRLKQLDNLTESLYKHWRAMSKKGE